MYIATVYCYTHIKCLELPNPLATFHVTFHVQIKNFSPACIVWEDLHYLVFNPMSKSTWIYTIKSLVTDTVTLMWTQNKVSRGVLISGVAMDTNKVLVTAQWCLLFRVSWREGFLALALAMLSIFGEWEQPPGYGWHPLSMRYLHVMPFNGMWQHSRACFSSGRQNHNRFKLCKCVYIAQGVFKHHGLLSTHTCICTHARVHTHLFFGDWLIIQWTNWRMLLENGIQTLLTEEVATLCLHGIPHGQVALGALMPLHERVEWCTTVSWHIVHTCTYAHAQKLPWCACAVVTSYAA